MYKEKILNVVITILVALLICIVCITVLSLTTGVDLITKIYTICLCVAVPITTIYNIALKIAILTFFILGSIYFNKRREK